MNYTTKGVYSNFKLFREEYANCRFDFVKTAYGNVNIFKFFIQRNIIKMKDISPPDFITELLSEGYVELADFIANISELKDENTYNTAEKTCILDQVISSAENICIDYPNICKRAILWAEKKFPDVNYFKINEWNLAKRLIASGKTSKYIKYIYKKYEFPKQIVFENYALKWRTKNTFINAIINSKEHHINWVADYFNITKLDLAEKYDYIQNEHETHTMLEYIMPTKLNHKIIHSLEWYMKKYITLVPTTIEYLLELINSRLETHTMNIKQILDFIKIDITQTNIINHVMRWIEHILGYNKKQYILQFIIEYLEIPKHIHRYKNVDVIQFIINGRITYLNINSIIYIFNYYEIKQEEYDIEIWCEFLTNIICRCTTSKEKYNHLKWFTERYNIPTTDLISMTPRGYKYPLLYQILVSQLNKENIELIIDAYNITNETVKQIYTYEIVVEIHNWYTCYAKNAQHYEYILKKFPCLCLD